ncbi:MAG: hypothetical protein ACR2RB_11750 [Gammaproteobacteria bacterium]
MNGINVPDGFELIESPFQGRPGPRGQRGLTGRAGERPDHEWSESGIHLRFQTAGGTWGPWMQVRGDQGPTGPMPPHRWDGTSLTFMQPDGSWGETVALRGAHFVPEIDGYRLRFRRTDEAPNVTAWRNIRGQRGQRGAIPEHEVDAGRLRFQKPDGDWGEIIDIRALLEPSVQQGPPGPVPKHQIDQANYRIRFEQPSGGWGSWLEMPASSESKVVWMGGGGSGGAAGPTPVAIPVTAWDPTTGTFPAGSLNGQVYKSTGAAVIDGQTIAVGDLITALTANASTTTYGTDWNLQPKTHDATATPQFAVEQLPLYATVQAFERFLLVRQPQGEDNGWWYADPDAATWVQVEGGAVGGSVAATTVDEWTDLIDTDAALGQPGDLVAVSATGTRLTFVDIDGGTF